MTDTINNVPCELLETLIEQHITAHGFTNHTARQAQLILCAPSPAGVGGLEVVSNWVLFDAEADKPYIKKMLPEGLLAFFDCEEDARRAKANNPGTDYKRIDRVKAEDAQSIIDGLRGEVGEQEETANQWREMALQFDRHRMTAMAHIRAAASGDKSAIEALGVFAALPPIPGHEITAERDRQAQRIGELASHLEFAVTLLTVAGIAGNAQVEAMRATLSAGKDSAS